MNNVEVAKKFITGYFKKGGSWEEDLALYVKGEGVFSHVLQRVAEADDGTVMSASEEANHLLLNSQLGVDLIQLA